MNPLVETWLVAARDCRKNVRSVKGIVMAGISLLGALACTFKLPKFEEAMAQMRDLGPEQMHAVKAQAFGKIYGDELTGEALANAPIKLVFLFFIAVWLVPLLVMIIGFDGISSDLQYRSVRYWTIRSRRASYYVGKFFALWAVIGLLTLVMQLMIWGITIARVEATPVETIEWGLRFWVTSLQITGAWCGIATLTSSLFRTPMLSLLATGATFFLLFFLGLVIGKWGNVTWLSYLYPNNFDAWIMSSKNERVFEGLGVCFAFILATCGIGSGIFIQRDV